MSGYRIGFAGSLLLHFSLLGIWWALATPRQPSARSVDQPLPLTLAMFQEAPTARPEPNPASVSGVPSNASENSAAKPSPKQEAEARKVQEPAKQAPTEEPPAQTQVTEARAANAAAQPSLQRKQEPKPATAPRAAESRPTRMEEAKRQPISLQRSSEPRRAAKPLANAVPRPAAVAAIPRSADMAAYTAAQPKADAARAAKLEDEYLERVWRALERSKFYPRRARRRGLHGQVQVRFRVLRDGSFDDLEVIASSGSRLLDQAALQTVTKVSGAFPFPSELPKQALLVSLPIAYRWQ
jgi:protein TonB